MVRRLAGIVAVAALALLASCTSSVGGGGNAPTGSKGKAPTITGFAAFIGTPNGVLLSGNSGTLSWTLGGGTATKVTLDQGVGDVTGLTGKVVTPATTTTYTLKASNAAGSATASVTITVGLNATAIAAYHEHALAVTPSGQAVAWGFNNAGQLGDGTTTARASAAPVAAGAGLGAVQAVSAGTSFSLALDASGTAWGWGTDTVYQLGDGQTASQPTPVKVDQSAGPAAIGSLHAGLYHVLAIDTNGALWAWGWDYSGQLGTAVHASATVPTRVDTSSGLTSVVAAAAGYNDSYAVDANQDVWSWGDATGDMLGTGATSTAWAPAKIPGLSGITAVAAGASHVLALASDGTLWAWGDNGFGQLGDGSNTSSATPVHLGTALISNVSAIAAGNGSSLALESDGTVWVWGYRAIPLSNGGFGASNTPVQVTGLGTAQNQKVTAIAAGDDFFLAREADGSVWAWGSSNNGQLGNGALNTSSNTPVQVLTAP